MKLSNYFILEEFGGVKPDPRLLWLCDFIRVQTGQPVIISNSAREVEKHVEIYKKLEREGKIKTRKNGLGHKDLIDIIPWKSRHLPRHKRNHNETLTELRGIDLQAGNGNEGLYTGDEIKTIIMQALLSGDYTRFCNKNGFQSNSYVGLGIGEFFAHIDVGRSVHTEWRY